MRDARELAHQLGALGDVADRIAGDERGAVDHAVGEKRAAAGREEVALVAAEGEVGQAVGAVTLDERRRLLALARFGGGNLERPEPQPEAAGCQCADQDHQRVVEAIRPRVVACEVQHEDRDDDAERQHDLGQRQDGRRVTGRDELPARLEERGEQHEVYGRLLHVQALREMRDRRDGDDEHGEHPGAVLAARQAAGEPDRAEAERDNEGAGGRRHAGRQNAVDESQAVGCFGVSPETIETRPANVANQASSVGVAGRRTGAHGSAVAGRRYPPSAL